MLPSFAVGSAVGVAMSLVSATEHALTFGGETLPFVAIVAIVDY